MQEALLEVVLVRLDKAVPVVGIIGTVFKTSSNNIPAATGGEHKYLVEMPMVL